MIPAPTLEHIKAHKDNYPNALCSILFAPPFSRIGREGIIPRFAYLDARSGQSIHFYCAGYMGYADGRKFPDMEEIGKCGTKNPWSFSQTEFASFVGSFELATTWMYSGEADMIVLSSSVDFDDCLTFALEKMVADGTLNGSAELFEAIIRYAQNHPSKGSPTNFSDHKLPAVFASAFAAALPNYLNAALKVGRHYAVKSIAR